MRLVASLLVATTMACGGPSPTTPTTPTSTTPPATPAAGKLLVLVDDSGVGLGGHDPVAYIADLEVVPGRAEHTSQHGGAIYRFASAEHKAVFDAAADKHAPQYGGYCAFAASQNRLSETDPAVFQVIEGQLLLFTDLSFKQQFNADARGNKAKADQYWPGLVAKHGK
jgi:YHS domain-containing protein